MSRWRAVELLVATLVLVGLLGALAAALGARGVALGVGCAALGWVLLADVPAGPAPRGRDSTGPTDRGGAA